MTETIANLTNQLRRDIDHMPPQLQAAAKYVIDNPGDFGIDPIRVTADKIGVSSNVLVRLAHRLGFDGFDALRTPFRQSLVTDREDSLGQDWLARMQTDDDFSAAQAEFARNELNVTTRSLRLMKPDQVKRAISHILEARRCFITATRATYGLANYFHYAGRMAHPRLHLIPRHMGSAIDDLLEADERDCLLAITVRPYSAETIRAMRYARSKGARIVLIADSDVIAPGVQADETLQISTRSMHHFSSFSGAMAILECLLGHLFAAGGDEARRRVEGYQKAREETGAYWQPSRPPRLRRS